MATWGVWITGPLSREPVVLQTFHGPFAYRRAERERVLCVERLRQIEQDANYFESDITFQVRRA